MGLHIKEGEEREALVKADNDETTVPLMHLISTTLSFIKDNVVDEINRSTTVPLAAERIRWVLTVPAIWDNAAKQLMIEAAVKAGLASDSKKNITIALEPGRYQY